MNFLSGTAILWGFVNSDPFILSTLPNVTHPCKVTWNVSRNGSFVDCSNHHLKNIPHDLPHDSVILDFQGNDLIILKNSSFVYLSRLEDLNLAHCRLSGIEENAFAGLLQLQHLRLDHNRLLLDNSTYHKGVFRQLTQLKVLDLRFNDPRMTGSIPDEIFENLGNLESVALDTFNNEIFGQGFRNLNKLKELILTTGGNNNYCAISWLRNDTFRIFENTSIGALELGKCILFGIEIGAFLPLAKISWIDMDSVKNVPIDIAIKSWYGLNGKNISRLSLPHSYYPQRAILRNVLKQMIDEATTAGLRNICIEELDVSHNRIIYIETSFIFTISHCLRYLDVSHNSLIGDIMIIPYLSVIVNLEYFDISYQMTAASFAGGISILEDEQDRSYRPAKVDNLYHPVVYGGRNHTGMEFPLPPSIKQLKARSLVTNLGYFALVKVYGGKHLTCLDLSDNGIKEMKYHVIGLENVNKIDFSSNAGSGMTEGFLNSFTNVTELSLRSMNFDDGVLTPGGPVYHGIRSLVKIKKLDLSGNNIPFLSEDFFKPFQNIAFLYLSGNNFISLPIDLTFASNLSLLDLSVNSITYLSQDEMDNLELLGQRNKLVLKLSGNPLSCSCESLMFVKWLFTTSVTVDKGGNYSCVTERGSLTSTSAVNKDFNLHWTSCQSNFWLPFAVILMCAMALIIVSMMLVSRNWTRIQHHLLILLGKGVKRAKREDFQKDAYIAHCENYEDSKFVNEDLRVVLEDTYDLRLILPNRDFLCGRFVADNVADSVNNSWKTVLVVTQEFLEDPWSYFIMKTAAYSVSDTHPNRVILLLLGNINRGQVPEAVLNVTEEDDIFELTDVPPVQDELWNTVKDRILNVYP